MPWCTYTDPEVAHVGLNEREARERGLVVDTLVRRLAARHVADQYQRTRLTPFVRAALGTWLRWTR